MKTTVLVIDDEASVLKMTQKLLHEFGYQTLTAQDGRQGLEMAENNTCDIVLTDMKMPNLGGLETAQELIALDPDRPVIIMTAYGDLDSARRALEIGIYDYLLKPFNTDDVKASLERAMTFRTLMLEVKTYQRNLESKVKERTLQLNNKVEELKARDSILRDLLSTTPPKEVLQKSLAKAIKLSDADSAILYQIDDVNHTVLAQHGELCKIDFLNTDSPFYSIIKNMYHTKKPFWTTNLDPLRKEQNFSSVILFPVKHNHEVIAVLELGKKDPDLPFSESTVVLIENFMPYVAMILHECQLQQEMPYWKQNIDNLLSASEKWQNLK